MARHESRRWHVVTYTVSVGFDLHACPSRRIVPIGDGILPNCRAVPADDACYMTRMSAGRDFAKQAST